MTPEQRLELEEIFHGVAHSLCSAMTYLAVSQGLRLGLRDHPSTFGGSSFVLRAIWNGLFEAIVSSTCKLWDRDKRSLTFPKLFARTRKISKGDRVVSDLLDRLEAELDAIPHRGVLTTWRDKFADHLDPVSMEAGFLEKNARTLDDLDECLTSAKKILEEYAVRILDTQYLFNSETDSRVHSEAVALIEHLDV